MITLLALTMTVGALLALATWLVVACRSLASPSQPASRSPRAQAWVARAWLYAPLWIPSILLTASLVPGGIGALAEYADHCQLHGGNAHNLCVIHPPHPVERGWPMLVSWGPPLLLTTSLAILMARARLEAREQACDAEAARAIGSTVAVARALTEVARLGIRPTRVGVGVAGMLEARVVRLLDPTSPHPRDTARATVLAVAFFLCLLITGVGPIHVGMERLLLLLLH